MTFRAKLKLQDDLSCWLKKCMLHDILLVDFILVTSMGFRSFRWHKEKKRLQLEVAAWPKSSKITTWSHLVNVFTFAQLLQPVLPSIFGSLAGPKETPIKIAGNHSGGVDADFLVRKCEEVLPWTDAQEQVVPMTSNQKTFLFQGLEEEVKQNQLQKCYTKTIKVKNSSFSSPQQIQRHSQIKHSIASNHIIKQPQKPPQSLPKVISGLDSALLGKILDLLVLRLQSHLCFALPGKSRLELSQKEDILYLCIENIWNIWMP